ncbi:hypothetical protein KEM52_001616 [Ascosphaera acerosa]|nr:hypothetical protein KEM52_001616 [Ascosphaera acerosa]
MTKLRTIGSTDPTPLRGAVAYNVVELFRKSLQYMKQYALLAAEAQTRAASTAGRKKVIKAYKSCKSRAANTRAAAAAQPSPLVRGTLDRFAQLLHTMLAATAGLNGGLSLTEGLMFFLLETAGWLLSQLTFSGMQSDAALVDDSQTLPAIAMDPVLHGANDEAATRAAQWLCRYIVWLLQQALQVGGSGGQGTLTRPTPNLLARLGKSRLQRTVLRAIFGAECFQDGLASMAPPAVKLQHKEGDEGITDWYTQELWQLVGWDVLSTAAANPTQAA